MRPVFVGLLVGSAWWAAYQLVLLIRADRKADRARAARLQTANLGRRSTGR